METNMKEILKKAKKMVTEQFFIPQGQNLKVILRMILFKESNDTIIAVLKSVIFEIQIWRENIKIFIIKNY